MTEDSLPSGIEELPVSACWELLASAEVGRLALMAGSSLEIFPINYVVSGGTVVFRTGVGTKLIGALHSPEVAFEADGYDAATHLAWSVIVKGGVEKVTVTKDLANTRELPLHPWEGSRKNIFVRIVPRRITGRRFRVARPSTAASPGDA